MEKKTSLFLAILTLGFAQQIFAQDENASVDDTERWSDFLPLNKELAGDADLPLPFGIGITGYWQEQDLKAKSIGLPNIKIDSVINVVDNDVRTTWAAILTGIDPTETLSGTLKTMLGALPSTFDATAKAGKVESEVDNYSVRLDAWILPFLNVYGVYGEVDGENKVSDIEVTVPAAYQGLVGSLVPSSFTLPYEGSVYGIGTVLAVGKGRYWGTIDYNFTRANLDISTSEIDTHTVTPRVGVKGEAGGIKGSLWVGSMFQRTDEKQLGSLTFPVGDQTLDISTLARLPANTLMPHSSIDSGSIPASYDVLLEQEKEWNFLVGGSAQLSKQINISVEGGFGNREQVMGNLTFRF